MSGKKKNILYSLNLFMVKQYSNKKIRNKNGHYLKIKWSTLKEIIANLKVYGPKEALLK